MRPPPSQAYAANLTRGGVVCRGVTPPSRKGAKRMRRVVLVLVAMALALLLVSGVAWAVNKIGTDGPDTLRGTNGDDNLLGRGANDVLYALAGRDNLLGAEGKDWLLTHP